MSLHNLDGAGERAVEEDAPKPKHGMNVALQLATTKGWWWRRLRPALLLLALGSTSAATAPNAAQLSMAGVGQAFVSQAETVRRPATPTSIQLTSQTTPNPALPPPTEPDALTVTFSFDAAPLPAVLDAIIGQSLRRPFFLDPSLSNRTITLRTPTRVTPIAALALLEQTLRLDGISIVERPDGSFSIAQSEKLSGLQTIPTIGSNPQRLGSLLVIPLRFIPAKEMGKILETIADRKAVVRVDDVREFLILSGDSGTLNVLAETVALFDVDWLAQSAFDFVPVRYSPVETLAADVRRLLGSEAGLVGSQVELMPIARQSAILIISKQPDRLPSVRQWIERLDSPPPGDGRSVHFSPVRNLPAEDVAAALSGLLGSGADAGFASAPAPSPLERGTAQNNAPERAAPPDANQGGSARLQLASGVRIQTAPQMNGRLIYSSDIEFSLINKAIAQIDVPPTQVMIEVTVVEVVLNDQLKYGVQWFFDTRDDASLTFSSASNGAVASSFPGFSYRFQGRFIRAALNALASVTEVQVISSPQLVTLSGQTARLQVGDQVPVVSQSTTGLTEDSRILNRVEYRDTGIVLSVKPRVGSDGLVIVDIQQEVSDVAGTTSSGIDSPTIQQRRFETRAAIQDGESVALGGLIRSTRSGGQSGVPLLKDMPLLGGLFQSNDTNSRRTELIVFLTPRVLRTNSDASINTDEMRRRLEQIRGTALGPRVEPTPTAGAQK